MGRRKKKASFSTNKLKSIPSISSSAVAATTRLIQNHAMDIHGKLQTSFHLSQQPSRGKENGLQPTEQLQCNCRRTPYELRQIRLIGIESWYGASSSTWWVDGSADLDGYLWNQAEFDIIKLKIRISPFPSQKAEDDN